MRRGRSPATATPSSLGPESRLASPPPLGASIPLLDGEEWDPRPPQQRGVRRPAVRVDETSLEPSYGQDGNESRRQQQVEVLRRQIEQAGLGAANSSEGIQGSDERGQSSRLLGEEGADRRSGEQVSPDRGTILQQPEQRAAPEHDGTSQSAAPMPSGHQGTSISATLEPSRTSQVTAEGTGDRGDVEERARSHKDRFAQVPEDAPRDSALQVMPWRASLVEPSREEHQPGAAVTNPRPDLRSPESVGVHTHESRMEELMAAMLANLQTLGARG